MAGNIESVRLPWQCDFPPVCLHSPYGFFNHREKKYCSDKRLKFVKGFDVPREDLKEAYDTAESIVYDYIREEALEDIFNYISAERDRTRVIAPVKADYLRGNILASTFASILGTELGVKVVKGVYQKPQCGFRRDKSRDFYTRIANPTEFYCDSSYGDENEVIGSFNYIIADDVVTYGGTVCGLRAFIESAGGRVVCMTALAGMVVTDRDRLNSIRRLSPKEQGNYCQHGAFGCPAGRLAIAVSGDTLESLRALLGKRCESILEEVLGYEIECCTEGEARKLHSLVVGEAGRRGGVDEAVDHIREGIIRARRTRNAKVS